VVTQCSGKKNRKVLGKKVHQQKKKKRGKERGVELHEKPKGRRQNGVGKGGMHLRSGLRGLAKKEGTGSKKLVREGR